MKKHTSQLGRLVAAITLPFVMGACMSWQQQELTGLAGRGYPGSA